MTIDKIKLHISPTIFEYWASLHRAVSYGECIEKMTSAYLQLTNEVESGIRKNSLQVQAEISLLRHLMK